MPCPYGTSFGVPHSFTYPNQPSQWRHLHNPSLPRKHVPYPDTGRESTPPLHMETFA